MSSNLTGYGALNITGNREQKKEKSERKRVKERKGIPLNKVSKCDNISIKRPNRGKYNFTMRCSTVGSREIVISSDPRN